MFPNMLKKVSMNKNEASEEHMYYIFSNINEIYPRWNSIDISIICVENTKDTIHVSKDEYDSFKLYVLNVIHDNKEGVFIYTCKTEDGIFTNYELHNIYEVVKEDKYIN